jgi:hypothetical protein
MKFFYAFFGVGPGWGSKTNLHFAIGSKKFANPEFPLAKDREKAIPACT